MFGFSPCRYQGSTSSRAEPVHRKLGFSPCARPYENRRGPRRFLRIVVRRKIGTSDQRDNLREGGGEVAMRLASDAPLARFFLRVSVPPWWVCPGVTAGEILSGAKDQFGS